MKRCVILMVLFVCISFAVSAQGLYFDIGLGLGKAWTKVDDVDFFDTLKKAGVSVDEIAVDFGLKAGYGPFSNLPLYVVGELGGIGHRIYDDSGYLQFNTYIIGPGVLFYPIPLLQLGLSVGYSFVGNTTDFPGFEMYNSKSGFAWNISAAVDLGGGNHGCLIGIKYFSANNTLEKSRAEEKSSMFGVFVRYAFRQKT
jgi:hypothetical protein